MRFGGKVTDFTIIIKSKINGAVREPGLNERGIQSPVKKIPVFEGPGFSKDRRRHTLPLGIAVPSAQVGLTILFGKGRSDHHCNSHRKILNII